MRIRIFLGFILFALFAFLSASPWEGAAATAPGNELPADGFFIATNSFPRNTVVDITNIETGKSTRVIVSGFLESPGLLALVSREAAELIGMRAGSVSRIRMVQPSDPIAYLRFTEGMSAGIPGYDSGNVVTEETIREETSNPVGPRTIIETARGNPEETQPPAVPSNILNSRSDRSNVANASNVPGYVLEPEWSGTGRRDIIDLPEPVYSVRSEEPAAEAIEEIAELVPVVPEAEAEEEAEEIAVVPEEEEAEETAEEIAEIVPEKEEIEEEAEEVAVVPEEEAEDTSVEDAAEEIAELLLEEEIEEAAEYNSAEELAEIEDLIEDLKEELEEIAEVYDLVPAQEKPPENGIYGIDPSSIIPGISRAAPEQEPEKTAPVVTEKTDANFSIPRIYHLDSGRYYVQIAAFPSGESVENAIRQIDRDFVLSYKPVVYKDGDNWYRVLLGGESGLNQGESAAVLQRFRTIGYKDAFVRRGS